MTKNFFCYMTSTHHQILIYRTICTSVLTGLDDDECLSEFRFRKHDLPSLAKVLQIPDKITLYQRSVCSGLEAVCLVLRRLAYPCRYADLISTFARPVPVLCMICNFIKVSTSDNADFAYSDWFTQSWLSAHTP